MIIETITNSKFPESYSSLALQSESTSIFFSQSWWDNFLQTVVPEEDTVIWYGCKSEQGTPLLLWPIWKQHTSFWRPMKLKGLSNYYTTLYEPVHTITDDKKLNQIIDTIVKTICQHHWDYLDLHSLNPRSRIYNFIIDAFKHQKKHVQPYFMYGNWILPTENQTFSDYLASRPKKIRKTIKLCNNRLKGQDVKYQIYTQPNEIKNALDLFHKIYFLAWNKQEPYPRFIPGLVKEASQNNWLRLGIMYINNEAAAAQIWLTLHGTSYIYKVCRNPEFNSYSPGTLLTAFLMEQTIDIDQVQKIDYLTGDDAYKKDWMSHREERWGLQVSNPYNFWGLIRASKNLISHYLQQAKKYNFHS